MPRPYYLTTTLPYVNAEPHIGFAFELVSADIIARWQKLTGHEVFFNTGTDEHGLKIYRRAEEEGKDAQRYADEYAEKYRALLSALGISKSVHFIRTTDARHKEAAQEFWRRCDRGGYIYKKQYRVKYCVGCELEKTESELSEDRCPIHPTLALETIDEENYFFKFSAFRERLLALYRKRPDFVAPDFRFNEIKTFVARGLEDFSISRLAAKMPWGVPVPDDPAHVFYVWFDALVSYISALGWPNDSTSFKTWWVDTGGVVQLAGKDQIRQQAAMWQAMLMAAGLTPSRQIVIHGFITSGGEKMSKSLGNVVNPFALAEEYGTDAVRWFLARHIHPFEDSDFTTERFREAYNADLANGVGNLVSRVLKMSSTHLSPERFNLESEGRLDLMPETYSGALNRYNIQAAAMHISEQVSALDRRIQETEPFKLVKTDREKGEAVIAELMQGLAQIARLLQPFLPDTAQKISDLIRANKIPPVPLFPRKLSPAP